MLNELLRKVSEGSDLTEREIRCALSEMTGDAADDTLSGAFLTALSRKGECVAELLGGARFMRERACFIDCGGRACTDIVGTGGDGGISFNISTASAIVAAGAGVTIAKHGNRAVSGKCGSADVLSELGFNLDVRKERIEDSIREHGFGFLFARSLHPVMARVAGLRKRLGVRTVFNLLGPLTNPAGARTMVAGVCEAKLVGLYAEVLRELGVRHAFVVHGLDGLDEISVSAPTRIAELLPDGEIRLGEFHSELVLPSELCDGGVAGGDAKMNAQIIRNILSGADRSARRGVVLLNAAAVCCAAGMGESIRACVPIAEESIDSGRAAEKLHILTEDSNR